MTRREPCACGGSIVAPVEAPGPAVMAHGRSPLHVAWRLGLRVRPVDATLPCSDGLPAWVLDDPARGAS